MDESEPRAHGHSGHIHTLRGDGDRRYLRGALGLIVAFIGFELAAAVLGHSLALVSDAGHMLTDAGALAGSLAAARIADRPASATMTYGYRRAEILSATANGLTLVLVSAFVLYEAVQHLVHPSPVHGVIVMVVAGVGVAVNVVASLVLSRAATHLLNVQGAIRHVLTDLYAFLATLAAGAVIVATGFARADALASLAVVILMVVAAVSLLRPAVRILVQAAPDNIDLADVRRHILELPEVLAVHDLHVWTLTSQLPVLTAHVVLTDLAATNGDAGRVLDRLQHCLMGHFDVEHSTFQLESAAHLAHEVQIHE